MIPDFHTGRLLRRGLTYVSVGTSRCTALQSTVLHVTATRVPHTSDSHGPYSNQNHGPNHVFFFFSYTEHACRVVNPSSLPWATAPGYLLRRRSVWLTKTEDFPTAGSVKSIQRNSRSWCCSGPCRNSRGKSRVHRRIDPRHLIWLPRPPGRDDRPLDRTQLASAPGPQLQMVGVRNVHENLRYGEVEVAQDGRAAEMAGVVYVVPQSEYSFFAERASVMRW